jgi:hypothetical protein
VSEISGSLPLRHGFDSGATHGHGMGALWMEGDTIRRVARGRVRAQHGALVGTVAGTGRCN